MHNTGGIQGTPYLAGDEKSISSIVGLYGVGTYNAEYTEWYDEAIVKIFLKHLMKLLNLLLIQKNKEVVDGVIYLIRNPITDDDKAIAAVVMKVIKDPKYKALAKQLTDNSVKQGHIQDK